MADFMKILPTDSEGGCFLYFLLCFRHLVVHAFVISVLGCHFLFFLHLFNMFSHVLIIFCRFLIRRGGWTRSRPRKSQNIILAAHESFFAFFLHVLYSFACFCISQIGGHFCACFGMS